MLEVLHTATDTEDILFEREDHICHIWESTFGKLGKLYSWDQVFYELEDQVSITKAYLA